MGPTDDGAHGHLCYNPRTTLPRNIQNLLCVPSCGNPCFSFPEYYQAGAVVPRPLREGAKRYEKEARDETRNLAPQASTSAHAPSDYLGPLGILSEYVGTQPLPSRLTDSDYGPWAREVPRRAGGREVRWNGGGAGALDTGIYA